MANEDMFRRLRWRDRNGLIWNAGLYNRSMGFSGFAVSNHQRGTGAIYVQTHDILARKQSMGFLNDVLGDSRIENRGLGSMLIGEAIGACIRRGHIGMQGYLSEVDAGHFSKLKYFYEKRGFSVVFWDVRHPDYRFDRVGKIETVFDSIRDAS